MRAAAGAGLVACLLAAGCGGSDERAASTPAATATATPTPPPNGPEAQPGGAGDEQPARQRVAFTVGRGGITPRLVKVSAYFGVELVVRNTTGRTQVIRARGRAVTVGAGQTGRLRFAALRRGRYPVRAGRAGRATLVSSLDEP